jgi:hypothetical protein
MPRLLFARLIERLAAEMDQALLAMTVGVLLQNEVIRSPLGGHCRCRQMISLAI